MPRSLPSWRGERGYILLTLMLFVALLAIASLAWIQKVDFEIKRDREEELIHRGVQYSRALRHFVKKFGHYPARIEDLESTNNVHYLRKRYKDPITGKDFKFLRMNDIQSSFNPGAASGMAPGNPGSPIQGGAPGALNMGNNVAQGGPGPSSNPGGPGPSSNPGGPQDQPSGAGDNSNPDQAVQNGSGPANSPQGPGGLANQPAPGSQPGLGNNNGQSFGGLPIVGVASTSKNKSIRAFNKKDHYNQWQFIYDPSTDRGGLLTTPNQPPLQNAVQIQQQPGQQNTNGQNQSGSSPGPGGMNPGMQQPQPNPQEPNQQ